MSSQLAYCRNLVAHIAVRRQINEYYRLLHPHLESLPSLLRKLENPQGSCGIRPDFHEPSRAHLFVSSVLVELLSNCSLHLAAKKFTQALFKR